MLFSLSRLEYAAMKSTRFLMMMASLCILFLLNIWVAAAPNVKVTPLLVPEKGRSGYQRLDAKVTGLVPQGTFRAIKGVAVRDTGNSGLAAGDIDGDGWPDLYVCGMDGPNALYLNKGNWKFEDITKSAGVACEGWRLSGALFADVDGDGDLDLVLTSLQDTRNFLFINDGQGKFTESLNIDWVYNQRGGSVSSSMADVDGDGDLDLYVTSFKKRFLNKEIGPKEATRIEMLGLEAQQANREMPAEWRNYFSFRKDLVAPGKIELKTYPHHLPDQLYLNDGQGNFRPVTDAEERFRDHQGRIIPMPKDPSHEAAFRDVDGDGDPDLYVCVDFDWDDRFWINDGRGTFTLISPLALRRTSQFSMGVDFTDLNRDGHLDFITVDMLSRSHKRRKTQMGFMQATDVGIGLITNRPQIMQNTLQLNRGDGTWTEVAQYAGLKASEWSWGVAFTDVDLDGYEDLLVATGMIRDFMDADTTERIKKEGQGDDIKSLTLTSHWFPKLPTQNMAYRNKGDLTFEFVNKEWGFDIEAVSGGLAQADFDGDGDLDLIFNNLGPDPLEIYRNESNAPRVAVRLIGKGGNTQAIGAKVRLIGGPGGPAPIEQEIHCGGGYASGSDMLAVFGVGEATEGLKLEIIWRNRSQLNRRVIKNVKPNQLYEIYEGEDESYVLPIPGEKEPLFIDVMEKLDIPHPQDPSLQARLSHGETSFDDFAHQSLLPNRLSQLGPGVAWTDLNEDGFEDLVLGSGRGSSMLVYYGQEDGKFKFTQGPLADLDQTGVIGWTAKPGTPTVLVGYSNYEAPGRAFVQSPSVRGFNSEEQFTTSFSLPGHRSTTGPMAVADVDGDGDLDLFIGGRMVPTRYPEPANSQIFLNVDGNLKLDSANAKLLEKLGLVSGTVFGDLDGDGDADLVLALEWGPVKVLRNNSGKFTDATQELGFASHQGWWNSVALGDFDADGRLDIVAGNWGRNSKYEHTYSKTQPLRMAYADFDKNGVLDIVEYHFDKLTKKMVPERGRSCTMNAMPTFGTEKESFESFEAFGKRSLEEVYGKCLEDGTVLTANTLAHTLFLNRGGKFEPRRLPAEAQFAPVFGINIADFDGDGHEDIFMAQNFFASQRETPRSDGGRGLLMRGDGKGGFVPVAGEDSGLKIYGEQRGSAVADYNHDGRPDLVVTQNGSHTRLYQNIQARPGRRVKVNGGPANPTGVGAIVRLKFAEGKMGPARLITAGSGYWSQDSAVQVLATPEPPTHVEIRWPNGETTITATPQGTKEISIGPGGTLLIPAK